MQTNSSTVEVRMLRHPFLLGSMTAAILGVLALVLLLESPTYFQSQLETELTEILVFGYFPITLIVSPVIATIVVRFSYGNTRGMWWYFGGSAIVGLAFSELILAFLTSPGMF